MRHKHTITKKDAGKVFRVVEISTTINIKQIIKIIKVSRGRKYYAIYKMEIGSIPVLHKQGERLDSPRYNHFYNFIEMSKLEQLIVFGRVL